MHTHTRDKIFEQKFQEHTQMVNKHTKTSSLYTIILATWIEPIITSVGKEKKEPLYCSGAVKWFSYMVVPWLNMEPSLQPAIPLSGNIHKRGWIRAQTKSTVLGYFNISQSWQPRMEIAQMFISQWVDKQKCGVLTQAYYNMVCHGMDKSWQGSIDGRSQSRRPDIFWIYLLKMSRTDKL